MQKCSAQGLEASVVSICFLCRRRPWHPTPVPLPGKSHGWRSLVGYSPWCRYESDTTERLPFHFSLSCTGEGNSNPFQCSCLENPRDGGAWWAAVCGVAQSWTRLKQLSSSSKDVMVAEIGCLTNPFPSFWLYCQNVFSACLVVSYMQTEIKPKGSRKK